MSAGVTRERCGACDFFVVVPMYNEANGLGATMRALAGQSDSDFSLILVDNGSTDATVAVAKALAASLPNLRVEVIHETQKGTGAAADTGFRYAIALGARWIARTDADCIPCRDWVRRLKDALVDQRLEFVAGKLRPRDDEQLTRVERILLPIVLWAAEHYGGVFRHGRRFKYPYIMVPGGNLGICASLYEACGGFPRTAIESLHEDRAMSERIRTITDRAALRRDLVVHHSARRLRAYGYINTLRWYRNHGFRPRLVDVR
jgi:glycosyltransferase involved in cell wall biosynthesis